MQKPNRGSSFLASLPDDFDQKFLLTRAMTHRSFLNENKDVLEDNERLEFLGDAILSYVVAEWLYTQFPGRQEGFLTKLRSALVQTKQLADFGRQINLGSALLLGRGEEHAGGRNRDAILCDAFEALVAAIFLGTNMETVKNFVQPFFEREVNTILTSHSEEDSKSLLQEWVQARGLPSPVYELVKESGPDHDKLFTVAVQIGDTFVAEGEGGSKQMAEKSAAFCALQSYGLKE